MVNLSTRQEEFIEQNMSYLDRDDIKGFLKELFSEFSEQNASGLIHYLMEAGIDVLTYIDTIPRKFFYYQNFDEIIIPKNIKKIDSYAFYATDVKRIIFEPGGMLNKYESQTFYHLDEIEEFVLGDSKDDYLPQDLFPYSNFKNLKKLTIPNSIKEFDPGLFNDAKLPNGKFIYANWRENEEDQIVIRQNQLDFYREHFSYIK